MASRSSTTLGTEAELSSPKPHSPAREEADLAVDSDVERALESPSEKQHPPGALTLERDDPENPINWTASKKIIINTVLCVWVLSLTYGSTAYVASLASIEKAFHVSQEASIVGVTLNVLGWAAGPLIFGPMSEMFGRRAVYRGTGLGYTAMTIGTAFAPNIGAMLAFRFLMGLFGSSSINNVPASIGDYTTPDVRLRYTALYALMAFGGPALGPLCSSFIERDAGWRWNFRVMAIFVGVLSFAVALVPETHGPTLLKWRIAKEGNAPPALTRRQVLASFKVALSRPVVYFFTEPTVTMICLYMSFLYAVLYGFFEGFPVAWVDKRHFSSTDYGLTFIGLGVGFIIGATLLVTVGHTSYTRATARAVADGVKVQPEARLTLAYYGAIGAPVALFLFAWTAPYPKVHWIVPCIAEAGFACSMLCIFTGFVPFLVDVYTKHAASALAAGMASRALLGSVFPLFSLQMFQKLGVQGATSLLAGICVLMAPIPFVFRRYGPMLRRKSRFVNT